MTVAEARKIFKGKIDHLSDEQVQKLIDEVTVFILLIRKNREKLLNNANSLKASRKSKKAKI